MMRNRRVLTSKRGAGNAHVCFHAVLLKKHLDSELLAFLLKMGPNNYRLDCEGLLKAIIKGDVWCNRAIRPNSEFDLLAFARVTGLTCVGPIAQSDDAILVFFHEVGVFKKRSY